MLKCPKKSVLGKVQVELNFFHKIRSWIGQYFQNKKRPSASLVLLKALNYSENSHRHSRFPGNFENSQSFFFQHPLTVVAYGLLT